MPFMSPLPCPPRSTRPVTVSATLRMNRRLSLLRCHILRGRMERPYNTCRSSSTALPTTSCVSVLPNGYGEMSVLINHRSIYVFRLDLSLCLLFQGLMQELQRWTKLRSRVAVVEDSYPVLDKCGPPMPRYTCIPTKQSEVGHY